MSTSQESEIVPALRQEAECATSGRTSTAPFLRVRWRHLTGLQDPWISFAVPGQEKSFANAVPGPRTCGSSRRESAVLAGSSRDNHGRARHASGDTVMTSFPSQASRDWRAATIPANAWYFTLPERCLRALEQTLAAARPLPQP